MNILAAIVNYKTNDHLASFIMNQKQLKKAINKGGFLLHRRRWSYDMLVTVGPYPYTQWGMK